MTEKSWDKVIIHCQVTAAELAAVDAVAKKAGQSQTAWLYGLIQKALSQQNADETAAITARLTLIEKKVEQVSQLEQQFTELARQVQCLQAIAPNLLQSPSIAAIQIASSTNTKFAPYSTAAAIADDDLEDEPDEILYSFLEPDTNP
jgi:cytochrome c-type biogenesis protein CcmH/NrfF